MHRATVMPCRFRYSHIFKLPYSDSGLRLPRAPGPQIPARISVKAASASARRDGGRDRRAQYVPGAILMPCADSARQIGTTPKRSR